MKGHKMNQTPLTTMEDRWVHSTKEAFDALVEIGYRSMCSFIEHIDANGRYLFIDEDFMIDSSSIEFDDLKQAYYHKGHFYNQPYEEFTITEEKVPFPDVFEFFVGWLLDNCEGEVIYEESLQKWLSESEDARKKRNDAAKIDRRLHKNRPLALAIGKMLDESRTETIKLDDGTYLKYITTTGKYFIVFDDTDDYDVSECTIPDNYIFPDQVIEWMHEYEKEEQCEPST